jgi:hypothetical protein
MGAYRTPGEAPPYPVEKEPMNEHEMYVRCWRAVGVVLSVIVTAITAGMTYCSVKNAPSTNHLEEVRIQEETRRIVEVEMWRAVQEQAKVETIRLALQGPIRESPK